jgi:hypothetical protein
MPDCHHCRLLSVDLLFVVNECFRPPFVLSQPSDHSSTTSLQRALSNSGSKQSSLAGDQVRQGSELSFAPNMVQVFLQAAPVRLSYQFNRGPDQSGKKSQKIGAVSWTVVISTNAAQYGRVLQIHDNLTGKKGGETKQTTVV